MATKVAGKSKTSTKKAAAKTPAAKKAPASKTARKSATTTAPKRALTRKAAPKKGAKKVIPTPAPRKWESRAVTRLIEAGSMTECEHCEERVKFRARQRDMQVICNLYTKGVWTKVEHFHEECYVKADEPYGPAED